MQLARKDEDARILLSTFSDTLANVLRSNLFRLVYNTPRLAERIDVAAMDAVGIRLYSAEFGKPLFASREEIGRRLWSLSAASVDLGPPLKVKYPRPPARLRTTPEL